MEKIAVFTGDLSFSVRKGIVAILDDWSNCNILVLLHKPNKPVRVLLRNQIRNLRKNGWRWIPYQTNEVLKLLLARRRPARWHSPRKPGERYTRAALERHDRVEIVSADNIHAKNALERLREFAPQLGVSLAAPILRNGIFDIPTLGSINLHKGQLPWYRGMPPAFWEIWNDEREVGCSIHKVASGLDTGELLLSASITRNQYSTVGGLQLALDELGVKLTCDAVRQLAAGNAQFSAQPDGGRTYKKPTLTQIHQLKKKLTLAHDDSIARRALKRMTQAAYLFGLRPISRAINRFQNRREIIILLYHRVSDEFRDSVTVGIEQFDKQMAYIAEHYPIASIEDIIDGKLPEDTKGVPIIAVTFDDGYLDNYENAAPILLRHQIPAAFFVSTGIVGSSQGFAHDEAKLGHVLPNMTWDQIREMHGHGFIFGSHSVNHVDCASLPPTELQMELSDSRDKLRKELAIDDIIFAYPFGGRQHMTPDALRLVKEAGYVACLSAYGGVNRGPIDKFNVLRMGVDHNFDPLSFRVRAEGWQ